MGPLARGEGKDRAGLKAAEYDWQFYLLSLSSQIVKAWADAVIDERQWHLAEERSLQIEGGWTGQRPVANGLETSRGPRHNDARLAQCFATQRRQRVETSRRILQALVGDFPNEQNRCWAHCQYTIPGSFRLAIRAT